MATNLTTTIYSGIDLRVEYTDDHETAVQTMIPVDPIRMENGTGSNQADVKISDFRTLAVSNTASLNINVYAAQALGRAVTMVKVKAFRAHQTGTNILKLFNNGSTPFNGPFAGGTPTWTLSEGGGLMMWNPVSGWDCSSGVANVLQVENVSGGTSSYDLHFVGTSA